MNEIAQVSTGHDEDSQRADFSGFPARSNEAADVGLKSSLCMSMRTKLEINDELERARTKFPMPNPTFVALVEEVGELAQALLKCDPTRDDYPLRCKHVYQEAVQVACMAIRVLEEGDRDYPAYVTHLGMSDTWPERSAHSSAKSDGAI